MNRTRTRLMITSKEMLIRAGCPHLPRWRLIEGVIPWGYTIIALCAVANRGHRPFNRRISFTVK